MKLTPKESKFIINHISLDRDMRDVYMIILSKLIKEYPDNKHIIMYIIRNYANKCIIPINLFKPNDEFMSKFYYIMFDQEMTAYSIENISNYLICYGDKITLDMVNKLLKTKYYSEYNLDTIIDALKYTKFDLNQFMNHEFTILDAIITNLN